MGYRIGPVWLHNFLPFEDARFDFSAPGLTCIEGEFAGHGCDSNGSGKSALIDGVAWIRWGRTLRDDVKDDDVIRLLFSQANGRLEVQLDSKGNPVRPADGCWGELHLIGGPEPVRIVRYQGHPKFGNSVRLFVNGKDVSQGRDVMTQAAIDAIDGQDFRSFVNAQAFGAGDDVRSFFTATDSERKKIMERILGHEVYADAARIAKKRQSEKELALDKAQTECDTLREALAVQERTLAQVLSDEELNDKRWQLRLCEVEVRTLDNHLPTLKRKEEKVRERLEARVAHYERLESRWKEKCKVNDAKRDALLFRVRKIEGEMTAYDADARMYKRKLHELDALTGSTCPTCEQVLSIAQGRKMRKGIVSQRRACIEHRDTFRPRLDALNAKIGAIANPPAPKLDRKDVASITRVLWKAEAAIAAHNEKLSSVKSRRRELTREVAEAERKTDMIAVEVRKARKSIATLTATIAELQEELARLTFWVSAFGNSGIKSYLIESEMPVINRTATSYAQRLLGPGSKVKLSATRTLKTGAQREELTVHASIPGCTRRYSNASKGQKRRLDLCLLLAFRDIVSRRSAKSVDQFFADELFDGLDETGEDHVVELLRELSSKCPVVLVTHSPRLKSIGERIITVRHENGVSRVDTASKGRRSKAA